MSEPLRMLDTDVPPHIRRLLEAGRDAEPHSSLVETTLQSVRAADLGAASSGLSLLSPSVVIPVLTGVLLSLGVLVGVTWKMMQPAPSVAPRPPTQAPLHTPPSEEPTAEGVEAPRGSQSEPSVPPGADPARAAEPQAAPKRQPTSPGVAQPPASAPSTAEDAAKKRSRSSTLAQRDLVLRARAALDGGAPQQALAILAGYETSFDELRFVPEVLSLRMQAHQRLGDVKAAEQLARRIIATYPRSSQARRARQLLTDGESREKSK